jgi:hypothetical protein
MQQMHKRGKRPKEPIVMGVTVAVAALATINIVLVVTLQPANALGVSGGHRAFDVRVAQSNCDKSQMAGERVGGFQS